MTMPSRKIKTAVITSTYVIVAMVIATLLKTPPDLASNTLWILGLVGGVTVGSQGLVDKETAKKAKQIVLQPQGGTVSEI